MSRSNRGGALATEDSPGATCPGERSATIAGAASAPSSESSSGKHLCDRYNCGGRVDPPHLLVGGSSPDHGPALSADAADLHCFPHGTRPSLLAAPASRGKGVSLTIASMCAKALSARSEWRRCVLPRRAAPARWAACAFAQQEPRRTPRPGRVVCHACDRVLGSIRSALAVRSGRHAGVTATGLSGSTDRLRPNPMTHVTPARAYATSIV
jgi:hypothetical protein